MLYKKFFDNIYKSHRSHDIVLLCARCHEKASASNDRMKERVSVLYGVPLRSAVKQESTDFRELKGLAYSYMRLDRKSEEARLIKEKIRSYITTQTDQLKFNSKGKLIIDEQFI